MGIGISGDPNEADFGTDFNYALWTAGTIVDLVTVPWNNDYRDVVKFDNRNDLDEYIDNMNSSKITINQLSYVKPNEPVRIDVPLNRVLRYNYLRAYNPAQPIPGSDFGKSFYYFILDARYIAPNTTELVLQLDLWNTFVYDVTFGNCYVERGHIGIANENAFDSYGRDYLTVPEGFDLGSEYMTLAARSEWIMTPGIYDEFGSSTRWRYPGHDILVISTTDLTADPGTVSNPKMETADGTTFQGTDQGASFWIFSPDQFHNYMSTMSDKTWVTQGITSISMIPKFDRYHDDWTYSSLPNLGKEAESTFPKNLVHNVWPIWRDSVTFTNYLGSRYSHLRKFWTSPYMIVEMTTFNGTPVALRPEMWNTAHARVLERAALLPPGQRIEFAPRYYNAINNADDELDDLYPKPSAVDPGQWPYSGVKGDDFGDYIDLVTQIANFPTMSIVNSGQLAYLASNAHGITYQRQSAEWTQNRALGMAQGQYDIATGAMHTMMSLSGIGVNADIAQTANINRTQAAQAIVNTISGVVGAGASAGAGAAMAGPAGAVLGGVGGLAGAVAGAVNTGIGIAANDEALAIRNAQAGDTVRTQNRQSQLVRDTNKNLADWAARGDYANQIAGINARVQDAAMIQPTTAGQIGGETMNMINGGWQLSLRWKMIDPAMVRIIGDYWLRYGYAIRAFIKPPQSLKVMSRFTYWKLSETYISSASVPESMKQGIRGILEKGVTVWNSPGDIGNVDIADNTPLDGISY